MRQHDLEIKTFRFWDHEIIFYQRMPQKTRGVCDVNLKIGFHHNWTWDSVRQFLWNNLSTHVNPNGYAGYGCWFVAKFYFVFNKIYLHSI